MSATLAALATAGASIAGTVANQYFANKQTEKNWAREDEVAQRNRQWQLEDRAHDEAYNSPSMQRARLEQAGLLPNDYVQTSQTASNTTVGETSAQMSNELGGLADIGSKGLHDYTALAQNQRAEEMQQADYNLKIATARKIVDEAVAMEEDRAIDHAKKVADVAVAEAQHSDLLQDIKSKEIHNFIDEAIKQCIITTAQVEARIKVATEQSVVDTQLEMYEGVKLDNKNKRIEIRGKNYEFDNILPLKKQELEKTLRSLDDNHKLSDKEIRSMDDAHAFAAYEIVGARLDAIKDTAEMTILRQKHDKYLETLSKKLDHEAFEEKTKYIRLGAQHVANRQKEGRAFASSIAKVALSSMLGSNTTAAVTASMPDSQNWF